MADPLLLWGVTSQAKILRPIVESAGYEILLAFDDDPQAAVAIDGIPVLLGDRPRLRAWIETQARRLQFLVAIGGARGEARYRIADLLGGWGMAPASAIHETASIAPSVRLGDGCQILRGAVISEAAELGRHVIVNTAAVIDHDCRLGDGVHVMPGAVLTGLVTVGRYATIGANATILPRIAIGSGAVIGAGATVTRDVAAGVTVAGNPARAMSRFGSEPV